MGGHTTLKRDGGWSIELIHPVHDGNKMVSVIDIRPLQFNDTLRWGQGLVNTTLGLLAELASVPESTLRSLTYPDVDRVMKAFFEILPAELRDPVFNARTSTPLDTMDVVEQNREISANLDPIDPRFPRAEGHVIRAQPKEAPPAPAPEQTDDGTGFATEPPEILRAAG